jgi:caffeoyl-CoA O-methyltransferase
MKELAVTPPLHAYMREHSSPPDPVLERLLAASREAVGDLQEMLIPAGQGTLLELLAGLARAERILEIGTFTGASALCLARGLQDGGTLTCLELDPRWPEVGRPFWREAGVEERIDLRIGDARETLAQLPAEPGFDLVFVDADKPSQPHYVREALARLRPGGVLLVDNTLRDGEVLLSEVGEGTRAVQEANAMLAADPQVRCVVIPFADGLTIAARRR